MTGVLSSLVQIARMRQDPSALPASVAMLVIMIAVYAGSSALQSWMLHDDRLLARTATDVGLTLLMFWIVLAVAGRGHRYRQTMGAVLGTSVLLTPLVMLLLALQQPAAVYYYPIALLAWAGSVGVIVWYTLIVGYILRSALEVGFVTSIAIAMTYLIASAAVLKILFPETA